MVSGMDDLFDDLMTKGDGDMVRLRGLQPMQDPLQALREQVDEESDKYIMLILGHKDLKQKEANEFDIALAYAKGECHSIYPHPLLDWCPLLMQKYMQKPACHPSRSPQALLRTNRRRRSRNTTRSSKGC